jgi:hypothetical protein
MAFLSNKHLPPSPVEAAAPNQHYVVSPIDEIRHQHANRPELLNHDSSDTLQTGSDKESTLISETAPATKKWQPPSISKTRSASHWWPWEWLCELLAVGSLGAMCFALSYFQDRPQADWQQSYFTLNGLVALLATLTKTGLIIPVSAAIGQRKWLRFMPNRKGNVRARRIGDFEAFDEASRGSLGSAKLIISLNAWYDGHFPSDYCQLISTQGCRLLRSVHHDHLCLLQCHYAERSQHVPSHPRRKCVRYARWQRSSKSILQPNVPAKDHTRVVLLVSQDLHTAAFSGTFAY